MQITQETDYAVRLVDVLARSGVHMEAGVLSEQAHVPLRFSAKILRSLVKSGIVCSRKGAHGGYRLARPAGDMRLWKDRTGSAGARGKFTSAAIQHAGFRPSMKRSPVSCGKNWRYIPLPFLIKIEILKKGDPEKESSGSLFMRRETAPRYKKDRWRKEEKVNTLPGVSL